MQTTVALPWVIIRTPTGRPHENRDTRPSRSDRNGRIFCRGVNAAVKGTFTLALYIAIGTIGAAFGQPSSSSIAVKTVPLTVKTVPITRPVEE
jgi:hypothetical protein